MVAAGRRGRPGQVDESLVDRAARRVLLQKCELGLLDPAWKHAAAGPAGPDGADGAVIDLAPACGS